MTISNGMSLWSQILTEAVHRSRKPGRPLETFPLIETTWKDWKEQYPDQCAGSQFNREACCCGLMSLP